MKSFPARSYIGIAFLGMLLITVVVVVVRDKAHQDRVSRLQSTLSSDEKKIAIFDDRSERIRVSYNTANDLGNNLFKDDGLPQGIGLYQVYADRLAKYGEAIKNLRAESESGIHHLPKTYSDNYQADMSAASAKADTVLDATTSMRSTLLGILNMPLMALGMTKDGGYSMGQSFGKASKKFEDSEHAIYKRMQDDAEKLAAAKENDTKALSNAKNESFFQAVITE